MLGAAQFIMVLDTTAMDVSITQVAAITVSYAGAQIQALKPAFAGIALFSLLALAYVRCLPRRPTESQEENK